MITSKLILPRFDGSRSSKSYGLTWKKTCKMTDGKAVRIPSRKLPPVLRTVEKIFALTSNGHVG